MKNLKIWSLALTLLVALTGCETAGDDKGGNNGKNEAPFKPVATTELATKIVNKWQLTTYANQPANFDIFIDFKEDGSYALYERTYSSTFEYHTGNYDLAGNVLTGDYVSGGKWNDEYTVQIAENPLRLRLIEEDGTYAQYEAIESIPAYVVAAVPEWDGKTYKPVPAVAASGYIEITHPAQFATLVSETDPAAFVATGKKVKIMNDLYFNNNKLKPVADKEYFRDFVLEGNDATLYDINIEADSVAALFPNVVSAKISNLTVSNITVNAGESAVAALIGRSYGDVELRNVVVEKSSIKGTNKVGGLVGYVAEGSIYAIKSGVKDSAIAANEYAGGLIGYLGSVEETPVASASTVEQCFVNNTTLDVVATANNSEFIGGIGGNDGDIVYIVAASVEKVTLSKEVTSPLFAGVIGGTDGQFTVAFNGTAKWNGYVSEALPAANTAGVIEIVTPSQFAGLLVNGYTDAPVNLTIKNKLDFAQVDADGKTVSGVIRSVVDKAVVKHRNLNINGNGVIISNLTIESEAGVPSAILPIAADVKVSNITFDNITVNAGQGEEAYAGIVIGKSYGDTVVDNVTVKNSSVKGTSKVGGLVGFVAEDSIVVTNSTVNATAIETLEFNSDEAGLAGGLIGFIGGAEERLNQFEVSSSVVSGCNFKVINSRDDENRANNLFIGGVDGDNGDILTISNLQEGAKNDPANTWVETGATTYKPAYPYVGGVRGLMSICIDGTAYWNGCLAPELPAAPAGVMEIVTPSQFAKLLADGVNPNTTQIVLKNNLDFAQGVDAEGKSVCGVLNPVVDREKFRDIYVNGSRKTISNFAVEANGSVAALFPEVAGAKIVDLTISKASVDAGVGEHAYAGAVIGHSYGDVILSNVDVVESTIKGTNKIGALIGLVEEYSIIAANCDVDKTIIETHELAEESGLAGGFIGYISCEGDGVEKESSISTCSVKNTTLNVINSRGNEERANSEFIGGIGGDATDVLKLKSITLTDNTLKETGAENYTAYHLKYIGGKRGAFQVFVDDVDIDKVVEEPTPGEGETPGAGENTGSTDGSENLE
ncbi:MAG: hypothetical protein J6U73_05120 [Alistipes sp.]|nr:hypothetical protein [Alistipes sp.]